MITAEVIADSISAVNGVRLTTMALCYPKYIHGELMTHRVFSRNARSSRAVPVEKILREVAEHPVEPVAWLANKPGMQGGEELTAIERATHESRWRALARYVARECELLADSTPGRDGGALRGLHKQWANRPLEPFSHIFTLVSSTYWRNFYQLRRHPDAQPEMKALADAMHVAHAASKPRTLQPDEWHLPYVIEQDFETLDGQIDHHEPEFVRALCRISAARCARVSYRTFENKLPTIDEDLALFERLMGAQPLHASPAEHQATPDERTHDGAWRNLYHHGNFHSWIQFRKTLSGEHGGWAECGIEGVL